MEVPDGNGSTTNAPPDDGGRWRGGLRSRPGQGVGSQDDYGYEDQPPPAPPPPAPTNAAEDDHAAQIRVRPT